jgi:hypothetical protein
VSVPYHRMVFPRFAAIFGGSLALGMALGSAVYRGWPDVVRYLALSALVACVYRLCVSLSIRDEIRYGGRS